MVPSPLNLRLPVYADGTGECGDQNFGEVVTVISKVYFSPPTLDNGQTVAEPVDCDAFIRDYLRWPSQSISAAEPGAGHGGDPGAGVNWQLPQTISAGMLGPDLNQYLAGQRWVACAVRPRYVPYEGSIRGSAADGRGAAAFAACQMASGIPSSPFVDCSSPHRTEIFGSAQVGDRTTDLDASCLALVETITGMRDPTAGAALTIEASLGPDSADDHESDKHMATCAATAAGSRPLVGTLIGIADGALPWG
jgi:hypothetical protein